MRPTLLAALAAALALAGCTPKTPEGAACNDVGGTAQCPEGQRCGADGTCSVAAMACGPTICTASSCDGASNQLSRCDQSGVCATVTTIQCNPHQSCNEDAGRCDCIESVECTAQGTSCVSGNRLRTCGVEGACPFLVGDEDCKLGEDCVGTSPTAQCKCPDQGEGPDQGCSETGVEKCDGLAMYTCAPRVDGSSCLTWQLVKTCSNGLVCRPGQAGACVCPDHLEQPPVLLVDPDAAPFDGAEPNGTSPIACRYRTLQAALYKARSGETVKMTGIGPVVTIPGPPAVVRDGVTLVGDESATVTPTNAVYVVEGTGTAGLTVAQGGRALGLTVRKGAGAAPAVGIEAQGASPVAGPSLRDVVVDSQGSGGAFDSGLLVSGAGSVSIERFAASGALASGIEVNRASITDVVAIAEARAVGNAVGLKLTRGDLQLSASTIRESGSEGLRAAAASTGLNRLSVANSFIIRNAGTGLWLEQNDLVSITGTQICGNAGSSRTVSGETHLVGGLYALNDAPSPIVPQSLVFQGNKVHENGGDQVLIGAGTNWNLSAPNCTSEDRNVVTSYRTGGVGVASIAAAVTVFRWEWESGRTPPGTSDVRATQGGSVDTGSGDFCVSQLLPVVPVCPP